MEREQLSKQDKLKVLESDIDRTKVNKNSKFNKEYKQAQHRDQECNRIVISAELYTREEAIADMMECLMEEVLDSHDYEEPDMKRSDRQRIIDRLSLYIHRFSLRVLVYKNT